MSIIYSEIIREKEVIKEMTTKYNELIKSAHPKVVKMSTKIVMGDFKTVEDMMAYLRQNFTEDEITVIAVNDVLKFIEFVSKMKDNSNLVGYI